MLAIWAGFIALVLLMLALDLGVFHRSARIVSVREALTWSGIWIATGLSFAVVVYFFYENHWLGVGTTIDAVDETINHGAAAAEKYLTGYVVEKSLSIDNIFVIAMIFKAFAVPAIYQHRVLFWGILGALVLRGAMISVGATLVADFHWILYLFAAFLIFTGARMLFFKTDDVDPTNNVVIRLLRRVIPVTNRFYGKHFLIRAGARRSCIGAFPGQETLPDDVVATARPGTLLLTPLAAALVVVETTDVIFAVDSIPAIFAITSDPFLVFTSNVFALLGLRSLYFALADMATRFRFLDAALASLLIVVGAKMMFSHWLRTALGENFNLYFLGVVLAILGAGVLGSWVADRHDERGPR